MKDPQLERESIVDMIFEKIKKERRKKLAFIEIKKDLKIGPLDLKKEIPLPLFIEDIEKGVKEKSFQNNIDLKLISKAIFYLLGVDENFLYAENYKEYLKKMFKDLKKPIIYLGLNTEDMYDKFFYLSSGEKLGIKDEKIDYLTGISLEDIYNKKFNDLDQEEKSSILKIIINKYEKINDKKIKPYAEYKLAKIYNMSKNYIKSLLYYEKALENAPEELKETIREEISQVEDYSFVDSAITYMNYGKNEKALEFLEKVKETYPNKDLLYFLKGQVYRAIGQNQKALEFYEKALKINKEKEDYHNALAITYINLNQIKKAIETYKKSLYYIKDSYTIFYNLGMLLYNLKDKNALEHLKKAYSLQGSQELYSLIENLEN